MTYNTKTYKGKITRIWITIIRHGAAWAHNEVQVMALSIKCDSLALRTESNEFSLVG